jgi:succinate-semialdehyde dehydrogenase/glutarate-semialdehyde dehydrogenase
VEAGAGAQRLHGRNIGVSDPLPATEIATGSEGAGAAIAAQAGKHLKKSTLEMGGNEVFVVLDDADLDEALHAGVFSRLHIAGQECICAKRLVLQERIAGEFLEKFTAAMASVKIGDPMDEATKLGPLSSAAQIYVVNNDDQVVELANDSRFGLAGAVFSLNIERAKSLASRIETGAIWINTFASTAPELPFGGVKRSGYGRELSQLGIKEFVNQKLVVVASP